MLFVLYGLSPESDVRAHAGGFVTGLIVGAGLSLLRNTAQKGWLNIAALFLFAVLVVLPWRQALVQLR